MIFTFCIADVVFSADLRYKYTYEVMKEFLASSEAKPDFCIKVSDEELDREKRLSVNHLSEYTYESTALYRKFIYILIEKYNAFFFHCSALSVDGNGIMFAAKSGTGKSTHRRLWQKNFGDKVTVINDDKPVIRKINGTYYIYDTPWRGKDGLGTNTKAPAKALCFLSRSRTNSILPSDRDSIALRLLNQTLRPFDRALMLKLLDLLDEFAKQVKTYDLCVNMENDAANVAYQKISEDFS